MTTARFDGAREVPSVTSNGVRCVTEKVVAVGPRTLFGGSVVTDAREIIAQTLGHHPGWSRTADTILDALAAAGFRIVGPEEVDPVTVEKCAAELEKPRKFIDGTEVALPSALACAAALRALKEKQP
jgi:hypothetical protein